MKKTALLFAASLFIFFALPSLVLAIEIPPVAPTLGQTVTHRSGFRDFTWTFDCGGAGGDCQIGRFIGGEYWIAPKTTGEPMRLLSVTPAGEANGLERNPVDNTKQGFLACQAAQNGSYLASRNLMNSLPIAIQPGDSLVKAAAATDPTRCKFSAAAGCCVSSYDVLTVLAAPPPDGGAGYLRPPFSGFEKPLYNISQFDLSKIPNVETILRDTHGLPTYTLIHDVWHSPYVDHYMETLGNWGRAFAPTDVMSDYGAEQNSWYLTGLFTIFSVDTIENKLPAITGLLQRGVDLYYSWRNGVVWNGGAGQHLGRKPPIVFFASLVDDFAVKNQVMSISRMREDDFQEDRQITMGKASTPLWGVPASYAGQYWNGLFQSNFYDGAPRPPKTLGDTNRAHKDPYGFIDGPAGKPGEGYIGCCSTGGFIAYAEAMALMPAMCATSNDRDLPAYVKRVLFTGLHYTPDECAPPDPREVATCAPYKANPGCLYYGVTWGPDPARPGQCIVNGTNGTVQNGRYPQYHGTKLWFIGNEPNVSKSLRDYYGPELFDRCVVN